MPDEEVQPMEGEELEVDLDEGKKEAEAKSEKSTADVERVEPQKSKQEEMFEIEEEDDTPPEDRGKEPLPKEIVEELESEVYSDVDAYKDMQVSVSKNRDYDEMYDDGCD